LLDGNLCGVPAIVNGAGGFIHQESGIEEMACPFDVPVLRLDRGLALPSAVCGLL